ncbi:MAG: type II 3-dehydroquinate dehydratase [Gammaproteobacteria bacterium]|jgi:3-dehydroquinate dehydratase-2|nr:type II 3-dehydroquinate dehydratase [Gammaproteobacteria bacterium]MDP6098019.1 type II 3-dehydroquinate dehydratase [Gammaproteobacteria bacterium]MDP7455994.1 type II 3-dehydroquinate dehydratase [Gammaproteobacteria bacterium]|tara:strand:+ start:1288 stop:1737 length:450 start_codon:yes stop_codon:yes gene_type:complete
MAKILALHGPNLNLLGNREPQIYGYDTLDDINQRLAAQSSNAGHEFDNLQSNSEADLIDRLHLARQDGTAFIIVNFGGFTHTSISLRDAMLATELPFIEVHLSNLYSREDYRRKSYFSDIAIGSIVGMGAQGYELALQVAIKKLAKSND